MNSIKTPSGPKMSGFRLAIIAILAFGASLGGAGMAGYCIGRKDGDLSSKTDAGLVKKSEPDSGDNRRCIKRIVEFKFPDMVYQSQLMSDEEILDRAKKIQNSQNEIKAEDIFQQFCIQNDTDKKQIKDLIDKGYNFKEIEKGIDGKWTMFFIHSLLGESEGINFIDIEEKYVCKLLTTQEERALELEKQREEKMHATIQAIKEGRISELLADFDPKKLYNAAFLAGIENEDAVKRFIDAVKILKSAKFDDMDKKAGERFACQIITHSVGIERSLEGLDSEKQEKIEEVIGYQSNLYRQFVGAYLETHGLDGEEDDCLEVLAR